MGRSRPGFLVHSLCSGYTVANIKLLAIIVWGPALGRRPAEEALANCAYTIDNVYTTTKFAPWPEARARITDEQMQMVIGLNAKRMFGTYG